MKILGFDTSTMMVTCGLIEDYRILSEKSMEGELTHSEILIDMIQEMLLEQDVTLREVDAIAVGVGPGSFTGLRIAVTAGKILSQVTGIPLKGVSSLASLTYQVEEEGIIIPVINARRNRLYRGIFRKEGEKIIRLAEDDAIPMDLIIEELSIYDDPIIFIGEGAGLAQTTIGQELPATYIPLPRGQMRGTSIALLGRELISQEDFDNLYTLEPNYLRPSQAECEWRKKHGSSPHF